MTIEGMRASSKTRASVAPMSLTSFGGSDLRLLAAMGSTLLGVVGSCAGSLRTDLDPADDTLEVSGSGNAYDAGVLPTLSMSIIAWICARCSSVSCFKYQLE